VLACDFLCVDTLGLRTVYVFFFIELDTRRVHLAGVTRNPSGGWVAQQARNLAPSGVLDRLKILIRDHDSKFTTALRRGLRDRGRPRDQNTSTHSRRQRPRGALRPRTLRRECLDWLLIYNERHLDPVPREYVGHYSSERPTAHSDSNHPTHPSVQSRTESNAATASAD
jgi:putative transposase